MSDRLGYALVAIAAMGWGTWPLIFHCAPMDPMVRSVVLMAVVAICTFPVMLRDRLRVRAKPRHWLGMIWLGIADAANVALFFAAYQRTTVAIAVLTHYLTPIFVAITAPIVLGERLRPRTIVAIAIAFSGLVLLLEPWHALSRNDWMGAACGAGSAVFYASNVIVNKRLSPVFSGSELMCLHCIVGAPLLLLVVPANAAAPLSSIVVAVVASLGPGVLSGLFFVWGLRRIQASHASVLTLLEPFVAVATAVLFLGQRIGVLPLLGGAAILLGALIVVTVRPAEMPGATVASPASEQRHGVESPSS